MEGGRQGGKQGGRKGGKEAGRPGGRKRERKERQAWEKTQKRKVNASQTWVPGLDPWNPNKDGSKIIISNNSNPPQSCPPISTHSLWHVGPLINILYTHT